MAGTDSDMIARSADKLSAASKAMKWQQRLQYKARLLERPPGAEAAEAFLLKIISQFRFLIRIIAAP
jgi:hypothetical protein